MNGDNESLIGPSGMELLKKEMDGLEGFRKTRAEEEYRDALRDLASRWFKIRDDEFKNLTPEQITALEITADKKTKQNIRIWLWTNIVFVAGTGIVSFLISPIYLLTLLFLIVNLSVTENLGDDCQFRNAAKKLNKKFDPQELLKLKKS